MDFDTVKGFFKYLFTFKPVWLVVRYDTCDVKINLAQKNEFGITSKTFYKLMKPEFAVKNNRDESGLKITTLIDKKTNAPVRPFVAGVQQNEPGMEGFCIMVENPDGEMSVAGKQYKIVGDIHFFINHKQKMITPKFSIMSINGKPYEKSNGYMKASANKDYGGIGTRLQQIRIERMLQNNFGNCWIVAEGNSFPFHYSMGYRLEPQKEPVDNVLAFLQDCSAWNKKTIKENMKFLFAEKQDGKYLFDLSASWEHFLCDYYKNGGETLEYLSPNMFLTATALKQWIAMIQKQPILY